MGLFEYHSRYAALMLRKWLNDPPTQRTSAFFGRITLVICIIYASTNKVSSSTPWPYIDINGTADNLISYGEQSNLFVTLEGDIYKYDKDLKLLSTTATGSNTAAQLNPTSQKYWENKVLTPLNNDLLLLCWQTPSSGLICLIHKVGELNATIPTPWSTEIKYQNTQLVRVLSNRYDAMNLIFASKKLPVYEESSQQILTTFPAISRITIKKNPKLKQLSLDVVSVLHYKSKMANLSLFYDYIHIFAYNQHTFFVLNDIRKPDTGPGTIVAAGNAAKLARICNNDHDLTSYTEILITCNNRDDLYAKVAYVNITELDPVLHIVFESFDDHGPVRKSKGSILCHYSLNLIEDLFNRASVDCNIGNQNSFLLAKIHSNPYPATLCTKNPSTSDEWCTSKTNPYIDTDPERYQIKSDNHIQLNELTDVNFYHVFRQGPQSKIVYFIGTEHGRLTKITSDEDLSYTIDLINGKARSYRNVEKMTRVHHDSSNNLNISVKYTANSNYVFATTPNKIHKIDVDSCSYHTMCQSCLSAIDPLECIWCGNTCTSRSSCEVDKQSSLSCPPVILDFNPKSGPTTGHTRIYINGDNFAAPPGRLDVRIGDEECIVDTSRSTREVIECLTKPIHREFSSVINIQVDDESEAISLKGSTLSMDEYRYANITVFGLSPSQRTGRDSLDIYGKNLDIGSNRSILLGQHECKSTQIKPDRLNCIIEPQIRDVKTTEEENQRLPLVYVVDGIQQRIDPNSSTLDIDLLTSYIIKPDSFAALNFSDSQSGSNQGYENYTLFYSMVIISLIVISLVIAYLLSQDKLPKIKSRLSKPFDVKGGELGDAKVGYRNPQSQKFAGTNINSNGDFQGGLIKLNGNVMSGDYFGKPEQREQDQPLINRFLDEDIMVILAQEKILVDRNRLTLGHVLGSGQFGRVYKGFLKVEATGEHTEVAVKTLHNRSSWEDGVDHKAFLEEGLMMRDFEHDNVLALIGVTFDSNGLPMVITPFMLYGDLRSYISDESSSPTVKELIDFGTQVARGMAYLSGLKFVHRDLAARNCMLDENLTVKVADFGLSRDIYERDYYSSDNKKTKLPVKWMAIESLEKCIYNTKTDVWSFGVLLWELMTRGVVPYPDVDNFDLFSYLKEGRRMLRPRYCPVILYRIMLSCWDENPNLRPTFDELVISVSDVISQLKIAKDGQQKVSRDSTYSEFS